MIATVMASSGTSRADAAQIIPSQSDRTAQAFAVLCGDRSFINEDSFDGGSWNVVPEGASQAH